MEQFRKILKFELNGYLKNRGYVGTTVFLVAAIAVCMFIPNLAGLFRSGGGNTADRERPLLLVYAQDGGLASAAQQALGEAFPDCEVEAAGGTLDDVKKRVADGEAEGAFAMDSPSSYTYYVNNLSMTDSRRTVADAVLQELYVAGEMVRSGLTPQQTGEILSVRIESRTSALGKDQMKNYFYTYIMIFALYMVIVVYGQLVATNVATEKSSRAMEMLITSARPVSMMFGKVLASCTAGLLQLAAVFGTALVCYGLNGDAWGGNMIIASLFDIPVELFVYMLIFFVLGFLIYAFLYAAIGSTVSKLEDVGTSVMPVTFLFIFAFAVVMVSMPSGRVDSMLMKACSYIPFTSPMAMFTRICMSTVPGYEIAASVAVLIVSTVAIGFAAAKIYRVGVLLYGTPPKIGAIIKAVWRA